MGSPQETLKSLIASRRSGWSLPQFFYKDPTCFELEMQKIWRKFWLFAGHSCEAKSPGDYLNYQLGDDSILLVRQDDGSLKALFNTCRHRGSQLVSDDCGHAKCFVCPYHQWSYAKDGKLINLGGAKDTLNKEEFGLPTAHVKEVAGLIFVSLSPEPMDMTRAEEAIKGQMTVHGLADDAKVAASETYIVNANWKLVWENNRECFHCRVGHPEYIKSNYDTAAPDDAKVNAEIAAIVEKHRDKWESLGIGVNLLRGGVPFFPTPGVWWRSIRSVLREGWVTQSLDGKPVSRLMGKFTHPEMGNLRVSTLPTLWNHSNSDYSASTQVIPINPSQTKIKVSWLVHKDAVEGKDYNVESLTAVWKRTGEQDWRLSEANHKGVMSSRYTPGPYSMDREYNVDHFITWYLDLMGAEH